MGLPPDREVIISRPLGAQELKKLIVKAHEGDLSTSSLSQVSPNLHVCQVGRYIIGTVLFIPHFFTLFWFFINFKTNFLSLPV